MKTKSAKRSSESKSRNSESQNLSRQRRKRTFFTNEQLDRLEEVFQKERFPGITVRETLTEELGIKEDRIQVWFQNRRARWRKREIKNKPAPTADKAQPVTSTWPESSFPLHPQITSGFSNLLPFAPWMTLQEDESLNPSFPFTNPFTYNALQFPLPPGFTPANSETSSRSSSPNQISPTEPNEPSPNSYNSEPERKDCMLRESPRSCVSSCLGRTHSLDEYNAAIGLLSVFERQD